MEANQRFFPASLGSLHFRSRGQFCGHLKLCSHNTELFFVPWHEKLSVILWTATAKKWNKSFTNIQRRARAFGRGGVWWTKSQSWLLNIYFRLSGFQSSLLLLIHFRYGPWYLFTLHRKVGIEPIRYVPLQFRDLRSAASLRHRNRAKIAVLMCEQKAFPACFSRRRKVTYSGKFEHSLTN